MVTEENGFSSEATKGSDKEQKVVTKRIVVSGPKVVGVGYSEWVAQQAQRQKIYGWVKERKFNKTVEALFCGEASRVATFIQQCHTGCPLAVISKIKEFPSEGEQAPDGFIRLPSS